MFHRHSYSLEYGAGIKRSRLPATAWRRCPLLNSRNHHTGRPSFELGRPLLLRASDFAFAPKITATKPSRNRRYQDFSEVPLAAFTCIGLGGGAIMDSCTETDETFACRVFTLSNVPRSWAWHRGVAVQMSSTLNMIDNIFLFPIIISPLSSDRNLIAMPACRRSKLRREPVQRLRLYLARERRAVYAGRPGRSAGRPVLLLSAGRGSAAGCRSCPCGK